ncbi:MAG TPA: histidine kinase [Pyrinomonadaceae bacterium]|jgi:sensor histidine kinase YesM
MADKITVRVRWFQIIICWALVGLFFAGQDFLRRGVAGRQIAWIYIIESWASIIFFWAVLTPFILRIVRRFPLRRGRLSKSLPVHLMVSILIALVELIYFFLIDRLIGNPAEGISFLSKLSYLFGVDFQFNIVTYWALIGLTTALDYYLKNQENELRAARLELHASELKSQLASAQLGALKMQLHPHFLFNTLNAIVVLVRKGRNREAVDMLTGLSELLRYALENIGTHEVRLEQEIEFIERYLEIEKVRFKDRLRVEMLIEQGALGAFVPNLILQPLVENALRHGIGQSLTAGVIEISARRENGELHLHVRDDGPGLGASPSSPGGRGIGIANTRARLRQLYAEAHSFDLRSAETGGTIATIIIPFKLSGSTSSYELGVGEESPDADR